MIMRVVGTEVAFKAAGPYGKVRPLPVECLRPPRPVQREVKVTIRIVGGPEPRSNSLHAVTEKRSIAKLPECRSAGAVKRDL